MAKTTPKRAKAIVIVSAVMTLVAVVALIAVLATTATKYYRERQREEAYPIQPLDFDPPSKEEPETNVVQGDLFSEDEETIQEFQTDCKIPKDACTAFSAECCPGLVCVPVNQTTSVCSDYKGSICIDTGMICNDAVYGVGCCDGGICTPEEGNTGRSRCVLPTAASETRAHAAMENPTPSPRPSLRPAH